MNRRDIEALLNALTETLAAVEHERWSDWQRHVHAECRRLEDGSLVLPAALVTRWDRQIAAGYADLSEAEKESDREQVRRYLPLILAALVGEPLSD